MCYLSSYKYKLKYLEYPNWLFAEMNTNVGIGGQWSVSYFLAQQKQWNFSVHIPWLKRK
jgi:hypothetical protein